jgi:hypothetical protein
VRKWRPDSLVIDSLDTLKLYHRLTNFLQPVNFQGLHWVSASPECLVITPYFNENDPFFGSEEGQVSLAAVAGLMEWRAASLPVRG